MKSKFKFLTAIFVITILSTGFSSIAEEVTKEFNESWSASSVQTLEITNKFGEVKISHEGGDQVTIKVEVMVEAPTEKKANELLELISINFGKSGNTATAVTNIDNEFKSKQRFSIDYTVNIPADKNLNISNKYGNVILDKLFANGNFNIQYGNFTANELNAPENAKMNIFLAYGKSRIESANDLKVELNYSSMDFGGIDDLNLNSKYSVVNIEKGSVLTADSKYDTFNFEEIEAIEATSRYSHFKIEELKKSLKIENGYGGIKVNEVNADFEYISVENKYGQVQLGLNNSSYSVEATCRYCGIKYPENEFSGDRIKENNTMEIKGTVGNSGQGKVFVKSDYGEIKLAN